MAKKMTPEEHIQRHKDLHKSLDELVADCITHTKMLPSKMTAFDLMKWSCEQTRNPTEKK
jgi:hypothetical protein